MPRRGVATANPLSPIRMFGEVVRVLIDAKGKTICGFAIANREKAQKRPEKQMNFSLESGVSGAARWN